MDVLIYYILPASDAVYTTYIAVKYIDIYCIYNILTKM